MIRPKSHNYKIGNDGILSIGNFILVIKNRILLFQLPGNWPTTKKCAPYFRGNMEFPIYLVQNCTISKFWKLTKSFDIQKMSKYAECLRTVWNIFFMNSETQNFKMTRNSIKEIGFSPYALYQMKLLIQSEKVPNSSSEDILKIFTKSKTQLYKSSMPLEPQ
jgi:hypothetical protein